MRIALLRKVVRVSGVVWCAIVATPGAAADAPARISLYVDDVTPADKTLANDASALTTMLCSNLAKDKRFDVLCAPDVRQVLQFSANVSLIGGASSTNPLERRLDMVSHVVNASFRKDHDKFVFQVKAGPRSPQSDRIAMFTEAPVVAFEETATNAKAFLDAAGNTSARVAAALLAPPSSAPPALLPPVAPK